MEIDKMKTRSFHHSNMGAYAPRALADNQGYIEVHDSPRYAGMTIEDLEYYRDNSRYAAVRAAAAVELAERRLKARED